MFLERKVVFAWHDFESCWYDVGTIGLWISITWIGPVVIRLQYSFGRLQSGKRQWLQFLNLFSRLYHEDWGDASHLGKSATDQGSLCLRCAKSRSHRDGSFDETKERSLCVVQAATMGENLAVFRLLWKTLLLLSRRSVFRICYNMNCYFARLYFL